ncbi:MAG: hypothetical protein H7A37_00245 [Chlamydiales bacterium]|nr:hypothetical protein [Chlamydiia bacterium]MCP5506724.1 hypothetical protein [Chlamydiales bacterium]
MIPGFVDQLDGYRENPLMHEHINGLYDSAARNHLNLNEARGKPFCKAYLISHIYLLTLQYMKDEIQAVELKLSLEKAVNGNLTTDTEELLMEFPVNERKEFVNEQIRLISENLRQESFFESVRTIKEMAQSCACCCQ